MGEEVLWYSLSTEDALHLQESRESGLTDLEARARLRRFGKNELTPQPKTGFWMKLFLQINNILIYILIFAVIISAILSEWPEVGLIIGVVVLNVTIGMIQEGKAERATDAIKKMLSPKAVVIRQGRHQEIDGVRKHILAFIFVSEVLHDKQVDVVPGDIVFLQAGDSVPADLRIIDCNNLQIVEAMLTGESKPVTKFSESIPQEQGVGLQDRKNVAYSATMVQAGQGSGVVFATGDSTEIGKIDALVGAQESVKTNLAVQLEIFGRWISLFVLIFAATTFLIAYFRARESLGNAFNSAISIAVAIIPEELPAVVTISLAFSMQRLAMRNAIIKQLPAIETLGSITVICSDKTGTLTKNEMTVQKLQTTREQYEVQGIGYDPSAGKIVDSQGEPLKCDLKERLCKMFEGIVLCNDSELHVTTGPKMQQIFTPVGYPTEAALLTLGAKLGIERLEDFRESRPRIAAIPFASEHKYMCSVHADTTSGSRVAYFKGAPDVILKRCGMQVVEDDVSKTAPINAQFWDASAIRLSSEGLRCLAIACAHYESSESEPEWVPEVLADCQPFLTMIGLVAMLDPPREEAIYACSVAKAAGIQVKMITGDHPATAAAIAQRLGIMGSEGSDDAAILLTGQQLDRLNDSDLDRSVILCNVFARTSPENKIKIVKSLQRVGQTCAMTGDGVNDAPALKAANIGVAMGITGTDVSKEAAKMILADDNFATIIAAVEEGRRVWDNLVKIMLYFMPVNFSQGFSVFMAYAIGLEAVPLTSIQVLYVNMITSATMGLMLALEPAEKNIMLRRPRRKGKHLFGRLVRWHCIFVSALLISSVLLNFWWELSRYKTGLESRDLHVRRARACAFNMLVFGEMAFALNCRSLTESSISFKTLAENRFCWYSMFGIIVMQIILTYTPYVSDFFSNAAIDGIAWGRILAFSVAIFFIVETEKIYGRRYIMPIIRRMGLCRHTADVAVRDLTESERNSVIFIATSASTVGIPVSHGREASRHRAFQL